MMKLNKTIDENPFQSEKLPKTLETFNERLATFDNKDFKINVRELAENGMFLMEKSSLNGIENKIICYFCKYECTIFRDGYINDYYEKPVEDHENKSPNCKILKNKNKEATSLANQSIPTSLLAQDDYVSSNYFENNVNDQSMSVVLERVYNLPTIPKDDKLNQNEPQILSRSDSLNNLNSFSEQNLGQLLNDSSKAVYDDPNSPNELDSLPAPNECIGYTRGNMFIKNKTLEKFKNNMVSWNQPVYPNYETEESRLNSFVSLPKECPINLSIQANEFSKAGFFISTTPLVKCFYCNGSLQNLDPIEDPIVEHARWFPKCLYVRQLKGDEYIEQVHERYKDMDNGFKNESHKNASIYYEVDNNDGSMVLNRPPSISEFFEDDTKSTRVDLLFRDSSSLIKYSLNVTDDKPYNPKFLELNSRLDSFRDWPQYTTEQTKNLSDAGFFYNGIKCVVKCFYCNGKYNNYDTLNNPFVEHAKWYPGCSYIRLLKEAEFVAKSSEYSSCCSIPFSSKATMDRINLIKNLPFIGDAEKQAIINKLFEVGPNFLDLLKTVYKNKESSKVFECSSINELFHLCISNVPIDTSFQTICDLFRSKFNTTPLLMR